MIERNKTRKSIIFNTLIYIYIIFVLSLVAVVLALVAAAAVVVVVVVVERSWRLAAVFAEWCTSTR